MLKNRPHKANNAVFQAEKRGLSMHYTGATLVLRSTYRLSDTKQTPETLETHS